MVPVTVCKASKVMMMRSEKWEGGDKYDNFSREINHYVALFSPRNILYTFFSFFAP